MNLQHLLLQILTPVDSKVDINFWASSLGEKIIISLLGIFIALITAYLRDIFIERKKRKTEINQIVISSLKKLLDDVEMKINSPSSSSNYRLSDNQFFLKELKKIYSIHRIEQILTKPYLQREIEKPNNVVVKLQKSLSVLLNKKIG